MAELSENSIAYLKSAVAGEAILPAIVYARLAELGLVTKVEGKSAGRGRTVCIATAAGRAQVGA